MSDGVTADAGQEKSAESAAVVIDNFGYGDLLGPLTGDMPAGPDLEYDPEYMSLSASLSAGSLRMVEPSDEAENDRDWLALNSQAEGLARRTRDLRVDAQLARTALERRGLTGLAAALAVYRNHLEDLWLDVHPIPDEEDGLDITSRYNAVMALDDPALISRLVQTPVIDRPDAAALTLAAFEIVGGKRATNNDEAVTQAGEAVAGSSRFAGTPEAAQMFGAINSALSDVEAIETLWCSGVAALEVRADEIGATFAGASLVQLGGLSGRLSDLKRYLSAAMPDEQMESEAATAQNESSVSGAGDIKSRADAAAAISRVIGWFESHEPSSPVPAMLIRARAMINKSFLQIIDELGDAGIAEARRSTPSVDE